MLLGYIRKENRGKRSLKRQNTTLDYFFEYGSSRNFDIFSSMWHLKAASEGLLFALTLVFLKSALRWHRFQLSC